MNLMAVFSFLFFTALVAFLSWRITRNDNLDTQDGYFLGGRSLTAPIIAGSLMLTNLSTEQLVGLNGLGYKYSMNVMAWEVICGPALALMAIVYLPRYLKSGITTIPDYLEERFDKTTRQVMTVIFILSYILTYLPTVLYSGSLVLNSLFNIPELLGVTKFQALWVTVWAVGIVGSIYAIFGGLKAVAVSDSINGIGLLVGGLLIPVLGLSKLGGGSFGQGIQKLVTEHPEKLDAIGNASSPIPPSVLMTAMLFNCTFYWATNQSIIQRTLAAKDLKEGQKGVLAAGFLKLLGPLFLVVPGIIAFHMYPNLTNPDAAYPTLVQDILPRPLVGFFGAVLFGAILSSFNSALNSTVTLFSLNIYRPVFKQDATDLELVQFGKKLGTILAIISMTLAPFIIFAKDGLYGFLQQMNGFFSMPLLMIVTIGFFTKRTSGRAARIALVTYMVLYGSYMASGSSINYLHIWTVLFLLTGVVMLVASKFYPRETDYIQVDSGQVELTPWKYAKVASITVTVLTFAVYLFFSKWGIAG